MARIKIEWGNSCDIGNTLYEQGFTNSIYFDTIIGLPKTNHLTEANENGAGELITTFQRRTKTFQFEVFIPEYVVDALQDIRLHNRIRIIQLDPLIVYEVVDNTTFSVETNFEFAGCFADTIVTFTAREVIVKTGCCTNLGLSKCWDDCAFTGSCSATFPVAPRVGQIVLIGGPSLDYEGFFSFFIYQYTTDGWQLVDPVINRCFCCLADAGGCDTIYLYEEIPNPWPTGNGLDETIQVWSQIPSIISVEAIDSTHVLIKVRGAQGSWCQLETSIDGGGSWTVVNATEISDNELLITGLVVEVPACGEYLLRLTCRKTGCSDLEKTFEMFQIPSPLVIWVYVDNVFTANLCPLPIAIPGFPAPSYLILPSIPCTNPIGAAICSHINEVITRNPLTGALLYLTPSDCDVVRDTSSGDYYIWNATAGEWQVFQP